MSQLQKREMATATTPAWSLFYAMGEPIGKSSDLFMRGFQSAEMVSAEMVRSACEAVALRLVVAASQSLKRPSHGPFDAVYISKLQPDQVVVADILAISQLTNIVDLSDAIQFDDGMD